ncbi:MAG: ANTAR domain-containing protein [Clostridia bacterium]|nr:ANTAR domain-containing protein [Clostridia bacterium]
MERESESYSALCVSSGSKGIEFITGLLPRAIFPTPVCKPTAAGARNALQSQTFDMVFINAPLCDDNAATLAVSAAKSGCLTMLFVKAEDYDTAAELTAASGVFTVSKPNPLQFYRQVVALFLAAKRHEQAAASKIEALETKLDEIRIINRAKLVLIQYLKMDETKAHRYIEKQAMDRRVTRSEVAQSIISTYEY